MNGIQNRYGNVIAGIRPSLVENSTIIDIEIAFTATEDQKEEVVTAMFLAGYKLRDEQMKTLTFQKEN